MVKLRTNQNPTKQKESEFQCLNSTINVYKMKYEILTVSESNTYMPLDASSLTSASPDICAGIMKRRTADDTWAEMIVDAIEWSKETYQMGSTIQLREP